MAKGFEGKGLLIWRGFEKAVEVISAWYVGEANITDVGGSLDSMGPGI